MKNYKGLISVLILLSIGISNLEAQTNYTKTGYFTHVYAREHVTDMPREFFLLFEADGTETVLSFSQQRSSGIYSVWRFDPKSFLGKTVSIDIDATVDNQNNEFNYWEGSTLVKVPKLSIKKINSFIEAGSSVTAPTEYQHPVTDTILMPHKVLVPEETYADKTPTAVIQLTNYVQGAGTEASPYVSTDGTAGLKSAINALPNGGTIEIPSGVYSATARNLDIPHFVSLKGTGVSKPKIYLNTDRMWRLKGSNTIDNVNLDVTKNNRGYTHEVVRLDNNARDITISNSEIICKYDVAPGTYEETGSLVFFRFYSHLNNITFENNTFVKPLRPIAVKGQKNIHNVTFKGNRFENQCNMCITIDQVSNMSNMVIEDNEFIEFSHFGIALARTNDVTIRNNTFYSRNLLSYNTYNQALHIEEHTQNLVIENNTIDVTLRNSGSDDPNSTVRSLGMIFLDCRWVTTDDNDIKHSDILYTSTKTNKTAGFSTFTNNTLEDGAIRIRDGYEEVTVTNNEITNPPEFGIQLESVKVDQFPFGGHTITSNQFKQMENKQAFRIRGEVMGSTISNNTFSGCNQTPSSIDVTDGSTTLTITNNNFYGLDPNNSFDIKGNLPLGNSVAQFKTDNTIDSDCSLSVDTIYTNNVNTIYPNPIKKGGIVTISDTNSGNILFKIYDLKGTKTQEGYSNIITTENLNPGIYLVTITSGTKSQNSKLIVTP